MKLIEDAILADAAGLLNRPAQAAMGREWPPLFETVLGAADDAAVLVNGFLGERWRSVFSGRSLRQLQALTCTEGFFSAARERHEQGRSLDWAMLAQHEGFADQAHMSRAAKHITGVAPTEFAQRFIEDESFRIYRLWA